MQGLLPLHVRRRHQPGKSYFSAAAIIRCWSDLSPPCVPDQIRAVGHQRHYHPGQLARLWSSLIDLFSRLPLLFLFWVLLL